jgi:thiol-disulfide isomerase/thioredoxin
LNIKSNHDKSNLLSRFQKHFPTNPFVKLRSSHVLTMLLLVAALSGCGSSAQSTLDKSQAENPNYRPTVSKLKAIDRMGSITYATSFMWWDSTGKVRQLRDYYGKVVVMHFWGTWCVPCMEELPNIAKSEQAYRDSDVVFLGVTLKESTAGVLDSVQKFVIEHKMTYQQIIGTNELSSAYGGIDLLPATVIISREGKVLSVLTGRQEPDALDLEIQKALTYRRSLKE